MQESDVETISQIRQKIEQLAAQRDAYRKDNEQLMTEITTLRADLEKCQEELKHSRIEAEYLSLSHKLADSPEALANARKIISGLIRRVDAAISLIKKDPAEL